MSGRDQLFRIVDGLNQEIENQREEIAMLRWQRALQVRDLRKRLAERKLLADHALVMAMGNGVSEREVREVSASIAAARDEYRKLRMEIEQLKSNTPESNTPAEPITGSLNIEGVPYIDLAKHGPFTVQSVEVGADSITITASSQYRFHRSECGVDSEMVRNALADRNYT